MKQGFILDDYAVVPFGRTKLVIIHNGSQLEEVKTKKQAMEFIGNHKQTSSKTGTRRNIT